MLYAYGRVGGGNSVCMKYSGRGRLSDETGSTLPEENNRVKKRARPRQTGAPSGRPFLFGFARPAGPDHGPKEDSTL